MAGFQVTPNGRFWVSPKVRAGAPGDVAVLAIEDGQFRLVDSQRNAVTAKQRIACRLTICRGKRVLAPL